MTRIVGLGLGIVLAASICVPTRGATADSTMAEPVREPAVRIFVEYGDPPVKLKPGQRARLSFEGRRGDIVRLTGFGHANGTLVALRTAGREVRAKWGDYYRLGADRRYSFAVRVPSDHVYSSRLLLEKLELRTLTRNGRPVRFDKTRRGFRPAVSFDLTAGKRTMITTPAYGATVLTGHHEQLVYGDPIFEVGQRLASARGDGFGGSPLRPGEVIVLAGRSGTVRAIDSEVVPVTLDGASATVKAGRSSQEVAVRFSASAGQLVRLSSVPATALVSPTMYGPTQTISSAGGIIWRVAEEGVQTVSVFPEPGTGVDVRVATVTRIGSMTADGPALRFAAREPGRWVYADVNGGYVPALTATESMFTPGVAWSATLTPRSGHNCLMPQGPNGCGEQAGGTVTETSPQAQSYFPLDPAGGFVILEVPPGASGSVDLQVTKRVPPYVLAR